jgi:hypothetical protein
MSEVEDQATTGMCYAYAATGVVEGLLHYQYGQNCNINIDEYTIATNIGANCPGHDIGHGLKPFHCTIDGGNPDCAFNYMKNIRAVCDPTGHFPNYSHSFYSVVSFDSLALSPYDSTANNTAIKNALNNSPIATVFEVWTSFTLGTGFDEDGVFRNAFGSMTSAHALVIIGYNDQYGYWICRNSYESQPILKIAYNKAGIDYWHCWTAHVDESSFAKVAPDFMSIDNAVNYPFNANEGIYLRNDISLNSDVDASHHYFNVDFDDYEPNVTLNGHYFKCDADSTLNWPNSFGMY